MDQKIKEINSGPVIFLGNEFFDGLPIKQIYKKKKLFFEKYVALSNDNKKIKFLQKKASTNLIKRIQDLNLISFGNIIEYPTEALKYLEIVAKKINKFDGGILAFDYGYSQKRSQNTLQSVKKHRYVDLLIKPSHSDITSLVNFKLFNEILKKNNLNVKKIKFLYKKASKNLIKRIQDLNLITFDNIIEYPVNALEYLEIIAKKINKFDGGILTLDYGYIKKKDQNTLQSVKKHRYTNLFIKPGHSDITSHINFKLFYKILKKNNLNVKKITTQNEFLRKIGILERANILSKKMTFKENANMFYRLKRLLDYREMGGLFKVLFAQKKGRKFSLGF